MEFDTHSAFHHVSGNDEATEARPATAGVGLHHEVTVVVLTTCSAYCINECLVVTVLHSLPFGCWCSPVLLSVHLCNGFICSSKGQALVVVAEIGGNAFPQRGQFAVVFRLSGVEWTAVEPSLVVGVNDDIHVFGQTPVYNFFDTIEPRFLHNHVRLVRELLRPSHRNADGVETSFFDGLNHILGCFGITPSCLTTTAF